MAVAARRGGTRAQKDGELATEYMFVRLKTIKEIAGRGIGDLHSSIHDRVSSYYSFIFGKLKEY